MKDTLSILTTLAVLALAPVCAGDSQVTGAGVTPATIAPGGTFKVTATVRDEEGLMGGFILNLFNGQSGYEKNIEYLWGELAGKKEATIEIVVGPGENSRYGDANVTQEWLSGSVTRVRLIVRDINDDRTTVDVGELNVAAVASAKTGNEEKEQTGLASADGWRVDFDDGTLGGAGEPRYINRSEGRVEDGRASWKIQDGVVSITGEFDADSASGSGDYVPLAWSKLDTSLVAFPVLEMRLRASDSACRILVQGTYVFADGSTSTPYYYVTCDKPSTWTTAANRLSGDSSLPRKWTPRALAGLNIWIMSDRPVRVDFDWVRLRALNAEEQEREDEWIALLEDYDPGEPDVLGEFFPFGVYAGPPDSSSTHQYFHRQTFGLMSRNHLNFFLAGAPQRREGRWLTNSPERVQPIVAAARQTGVRVNLRMRRAANKFEEGGTQAVIEWAQPLVREIADCPEVVGYDIGDERPLSDLHSVAAAAAVLRNLDPKRPSTLCFWDLASVRAYDPYVPVNVSDIYPLQDGSDRTAATMYEWCRGVARDTDNKRQWIILQSFGAAPWRKRRGYIVPSVEELRLMTWASLAGGARGIIYYSFSYDRYKMVADQWGNPNELFREIGRLGKEIIPIGRRLLDCVVDFETGIACDNPEILVGVLHAPDRNARYVIVANKDTTSPQGGKLQGVTPNMLDMTSLNEIAGGTIAPLQPGDGRAYLIGTQEELKAEADTIRANQREETHRAATPDRTLARLYGDRLPECLAAKEKLDEIGRLMGSVEPAMFEDNPDAAVVEAMKPHRERYWAIHPRWAEMYEDLLSGAGSAEDVEALAAEAKKIAAEIRRALGDRPMYPTEAGS